MDVEFKTVDKYFDIKYGQYVVIYEKTIKNKIKIEIIKRSEVIGYFVFQGEKIEIKKDIEDKAIHKHKTKMFLIKKIESRYGNKNRRVIIKCLLNKEEVI